MPRGAIVSTMKKSSFVCLLAALAFLASLGVAAAAPIDFAAFRSLVSLSSPRVSPDGSTIAFIRGIQNFADDRYDQTLMVIPVSGGTPRALTTDLAAGVSAPAWSPSGDRIAYLAQGSDGQAQIFVVSANGGAPQAVTAAKNGVQHFVWSPDGQQFAYVTPDDPPNADAIKRHDDLFDIHDDGYLTAAPAVASHVWIVSANGGTARRLTHGSWSVLEYPPPIVGGTVAPSWSQDGTFITFARAANAHAADTDRSTIATVNVKTGAVRSVTERTHYEYQPVFSPDGTTIAYLSYHGPTPLSDNDVYAVSARGNNDRDVSAAIDRDVQDVEWMPDSRSFLALADDGISVGIWQQPLIGAPHRIALGALNPSEVSVGRNGTIALIASDATIPSELYVLKTVAAAPRKLTSFNARLSAYQFGRVRELRWTGPDGQVSDGVLTYPLGYTPVKKYPLFIHIHGGPEQASGAQFIGQEVGMDRQIFSSHGYIVFEPDYRGSDNLGSAHMHAIFGDPGVGPANDVMAGIAAIERLGIVDTSRIAIAGHSYGGFMTTWLASHHAIFRVAVVTDGAVDWKQTYSLSADGNLAWARDSLGGGPWDSATADLYRTGSPISYVKNMRIPTLIFSGTSDQTVPITESYELYHALKDNHVPVRFVGIPGAHHFPADPVRIERLYQILYGWVVDHMK